MRLHRKWPAAACMVVAVSLVASLCVVVNAVKAEDTSPAKPAATGTSNDAAAGKTAPALPKLPEPKDAVRLDKSIPIWLDPKEKSVIVEGQISLREGMLEMFACTRNTKEHESIVSANTKAYLVHTGLLRLGAESGHPVRFQPEYSPPTGTEIEVIIRWLDEKGKPQSARAQDWIKDNHTGKPMAYPFVFGGSSFYTDPDTNKQYYQAEHGDFVCVANFGTAMLDIPAMSSKSNEELEFEAITKKIPPLGTPVQLVFKPKLKKQDAKNETKSGGGKTEVKANNGAKALDKVK